jgi:hypothetical protein
MRKKCRVNKLGARQAAFLLLLAGLLFRCPSPCRSEEGTAAKKTAGATRKILGRVLDAEGKVVVDATVCLVREDDSDVEPYEPTVIAQTHSRADGRFELTPLESELKKPAADSPASFEIWIAKPGFALAHSVFFGEPSDKPFNICLEQKPPFTIGLRKPNGSPCGNATVTPMFLLLAAGRWLIIPNPIQDRLKVCTAANGRVDLAGINGQIGTVKIETAECGVQTICLSAQDGSPLAVTLRETWILEGRVVLPKGEQADLSKLQLAVNVSSPEKNSESKIKPSDCNATAPLPGAWYDHFVVRPGRDGRFTISKFPKSQHGELYFHVAGFEVLPLTNDRKFPLPSFDIPAGKPLKIEIPLRKGVWVTQVIRDSQTKRPLPEIGVVMISSAEFMRADRSDKNGRLRICLCPGDTYHVHCSLPDGYLRAEGGSGDDVVIPSGVPECELKPIELVRGCTVMGELLDLTEQPLARTRVRASWTAGNTQRGKGQAAEVSRWTTTDFAGHFRFDRVEAGTSVTLVPIRAGVLLADPAQTVAGDDRPVRLQVKKREMVALRGRILGLDRKPIAGAQIVVEVEHSPDPLRTFRLTVDSDGSFQTADHFPKDLRYRLTVQSCLKDIASSDWICPAVSGNRFPDLVVESSKLGIESRLSGKEIVARVNGRPILASELLERAYPEPLPPDGASLLVASRGTGLFQVREQEFRKLQEMAIKRYVRDYVRTRVLSQALDAKMDQEQKKKNEEAVGKMFDEHVGKLKQDLKVASRLEVDQKLQQQGTSLASLKVEFRHRILADEYLRQVGHENSVFDRQRLLAYYQAHPELYATPPKVSWQLLEIEFDNPLFHKEEQVDDSRAAAKQSDEEVERWYKSRQAGIEYDPWNPDQTRHTGYESETGASDSAKNRSSFDILNYAVRQPTRLDSRKARGVINEASAQLRKGVSFEAVAKKFSNGPLADRGGWQGWMNPNSVADLKTASVLRQLPEGGTSDVIETDDSFRIVRVVCRTPAGLRPFDEAEDSIRQSLQREMKKTTLEELYSQAFIESPYLGDASFLDDVSSMLPPASRCPAPRAQADAFAQ